MEGWKCPACGGAHAPWVASCPVRVVTYPYTKPLTPTVPYTPPTTQPPGWWQSPVTCKPFSEHLQHRAGSLASY